MKKGKSRGLNGLARHPKSSTSSIRKGAQTGSSKGPYPLHPPAKKSPGRLRGTDA